MEKIGVIGAGTMGSGIAQVASTAGHVAVIFDLNQQALDKAKAGHQKIMNRLVEKGRLDQPTADGILARIEYASAYEAFSGCHMIIEAIVERLEVKREVFAALEKHVDEQCILASNTSSLSIASIASSCEHSERVIGVHFFNPAPLMPLVEIVPAVQTSEAVQAKAKALIDSWKKVTVIAKDTPGFIVNRVARPFYGEALRVFEEGMADMVTIDWAMKELGGFRMGPFELMDYIGNDINYAVTESVWTAFYYDPRYKPAFTQKRMTEANYLGRKSGRGYYNYAEGAIAPEPNKDEQLGQKIVDRIVAMLINEAADALHLHIASRDDIDLAMTKGVNYPKGLLKWADELGIQRCLESLDSLYEEYHEERYRASPLLRKMVRDGKTFY